MKDKNILKPLNPDQLRTREAFNIALDVREFLIRKMKYTRNVHIYEALLGVLRDVERKFPVLDDEDIRY